MLLLSSATVSADDAHCHSMSSSGEELSWTGIAEANEITGNGNYYLAEDIILTTDLIIDENINLCLNGHKINVSNTTRANSVKVSENGILNICDCSGNDSGVISCSQSQNSTTSTVSNNGKLNLHSGSISRSVDYSSCIVENKADAVMNVYGGKIYGTSIGIKTKGLLNVYGGSIAGEKGAIQIDEGETLIARIAEIDCSGEDWATVSLYGGKLNITGGTLKNSCGSTVIQLPYGESRLNISGGTILATGKANCINASSADAEVNISGGRIENNYGSVSYMASGRYGWGINAEAFKTFTLSGNPFIDNIYLYGANAITIPESGLQNEKPIGIHCYLQPMTFIDGDNIDYSGNFVCKAPNDAYFLYTTSENKLIFAMKTAISGKISLTGKSNINEILTAVYIPSDENETYVYQWYCDDAAIAEETNSTYTVKPEDINKKIKVVVSGIGYYRDTKEAETVIMKTAVQYTSPMKNIVEFNGFEQELLKAGECQGGVLKYSLSENGEYSEEIPKATNVGRYKI